MAAAHSGHQPPRPNRKKQKTIKTKTGGPNCILPSHLQLNLTPRLLHTLSTVSRFISQSFSSHSETYIFPSNKCFQRIEYTNISTLFFRRVRKISKSDYQLCNVVLSVRPSIPVSIRMKKQGSHWTDFHNIWYVRLSQKCAQKKQVLLTPQKNNGSLREYLITYLLTDLLTHFLTYLLTHLLTRLLTYLHNYSLTYLLTYTIPHLLIYSMQQSPS